MTSERATGSEPATENLNPDAMAARIWATLDRIAKRMEEDREHAAREREMAAKEREETARQAAEQAAREAARERERAARERERAARQAAEQAAREAARERERAAKEAAREREMAQLSASMRETDRRLKKAEDLFTTQWGRLVESLVEGDLVPLLRERGIAVEGTTERTHKKRNGEHFEIDILAVNSAEVVVVEVKTTLRPNDVRHFLEKLSRFGEWFREYRDCRIYGAVAYLKSDSSVAVHAERQGLFVIRATGSSASIVNASDFKPRTFS